MKIRKKYFQHLFTEILPNEISNKKIVDKEDKKVNMKNCILKEKKIETKKSRQSLNEKPYESKNIKIKIEYAKKIVLDSLRYQEI